MQREQYANQQSHSSFQPQLATQQSSLEHNQLNQPTQHSSAIANSNNSHWLNKANQWVSDKVQAAQTFVNGSGAIASNDILPALQSGSQSHATQSNQALVGIIDSGFGANDHGTQMLDTIREVNPEASIVLKDGVGKGGWAESLTEFVDTAKASEQTGAVANLSFDLTEVRPDGTVTTRSQLTAEEQTALAYARDNNVLVVASAGNEGGAMSALGQASQQFENVIAVGAAEGDHRAGYSSFGSGLDLVANGSKHGKEGTSFAAAEVTGAISEIWEANPHLSSRQVAQTLQATATDLHTPGWDAETGTGKLNVDRARSLAQQITLDTKSFSGAALLQQTQGSFDGATWQSKDGSVASERSNWGWSDIAHGALDVAGFIPVVGAVADIANAGLYAAEGDYANAALSAAAAVPGVGDAAAAVKLANRGVQAVRAANRAAHTTRSVAARAVPSRTLPTRLERPTAPRPAPRSASRDVNEPINTSSRVAGSGRSRSRQGNGLSNPGRRDPGRGTGNGSTQPQQRGGLSSPGRTSPQSNSGSPQSSSRPPQSTGQVTIRRGDTLWEIARDRLGSGTRWRELLKADGSSFTEQEARRLQPGTSVHLPEAKRGKHRAPTGTPAPSPSQDRTSDVVVGRKPNGNWDIKVMPKGIENLKREDTNEMRLQLQYGNSKEHTLGIAIKNSERMGITAGQVDQATDALLDNHEKWASWFPSNHKDALKKALDKVDAWAYARPPLGVNKRMNLKAEWERRDKTGARMTVTTNSQVKAENAYRVELENLKGHNLKM